MRIGVRINRSGFRDWLIPALPPSWKPEPNQEVDKLFSVYLADPPKRRGLRNYHLVYSEAELTMRSENQGQILDALASELDKLVARSADKRIFVHAGAVAWQGGAILLPGHSRSGKTTLVSALLDAGASLLSDEFAVLDRDGRVHPYPRPLGVRSATDSPPIRDYGGVSHQRIQNRPLPVSMVVVTRYRRGARWRPRALTTGQAILATLAHTIPARDQPEAALQALSAGLQNAVTLRGTRGSAKTTAGALLNLLSE